MRKRLLLIMGLLCGFVLFSWGQSDGKKEPKLLVDGCFFTESPSELHSEERRRTNDDAGDGY